MAAVRFAAASAEPDALAPPERFSAEQLEGWARSHGTPLYVYDGDRMLENQRRLAAALSALSPRGVLRHPLRANANPAVVALLRGAGVKVDVASAGELELALWLGFSGREIVWSASGSSPSEIDRALAAGAIVVVDAEDELAQLSSAVVLRGGEARIALRVDLAAAPAAGTPLLIPSAAALPSFGAALADGTAERLLERALALAPQVRVVGLESRFTPRPSPLESVEAAAERVIDWAMRMARDRGVGWEFLELSGLPGYRSLEGDHVPAIDAWCAELAGPLHSLRERYGGALPALWIEAPEALVGEAGLLLLRVQSVQASGSGTRVVIDSGSLPGGSSAERSAPPRLRAVTRSGPALAVAIVGNVGSVGGIGETLVAAHELPSMIAGDLVVVLDAGAFGFSISSESEGRPLPAELLVRGGRAELVRERGNFRDLLRHMLLPSDLISRPERSQG